jgi:hypothetical protein
VLALNGQTQRRLAGDSYLAVVPGATHLFEEAEGSRQSPSWPGRGSSPTLSPRPPRRQSPMTSTPRVEEDSRGGKKNFSVEIKVHDHPDRTEAKGLLPLGDDMRVAGAAHAATPPIPSGPASVRSW